jgi:glyoxylase-like metal-dependent hydrolase (beta-lactamase superfamily II)
MDVAQIAPGLWRWTTFYDEWGEDVGSVYCETRDGVVLIDPLVPTAESERFWSALDRDVARVGGDVHVLITVFWHVRSTVAVRERYEARLWAPGRGRAAIARRAGDVTDSFKPGDDVAGGIRSLPTARASEVLFWLPEHRTLVPGDVLLGDGTGGLRMCPPSWLPEGKDHASLAESLRPLLDLPVERVLVSHGEPVLENARAALSSALASS